MAAGASNAITEFPVPTTGSSSPTLITTGPDGALWFTEGGKIGRLTTTGSVIEFRAVPTDNWRASDITTGPDRALWFTQTGNKIGRIMP